MSLNCVHDMPATQCARCRVCPHGQMTSNCGRCADVVLSRAAAKAVPPAQPSETHRGYELLFIPEERSWYYRDDPEAPLSATSYRSAFLGRRAIDAELDEPAPAPKPEPARKRS